MVMRAVFAVFLIVAIKSAASTRELQEYTSSLEIMLGNYKVRGPEIPTELINYSNVQIQFRQKDVHHPDALHMETVSVEGDPPPGEENPCGQLIGVKMDKGRKYFCRITRFGVEMDYSLTNPRLAEMQFIVFFQCEGKPNTLLEIPVFARPPPVGRLRLLDPLQDKKVVTISPVSGQQLSTLHSSRHLTIGFKWLRKLLKLGVREGKRVRVVGGDVVDELYRTRPLVLQKTIIQQIMDEVNYFKVEPQRLSPPTVTADDDMYNELEGRRMRGCP